MIVALLGDIHANLPALEAVVAHAQAHGAEQFWNTGDFVGYGAFPNEIFDCLHQIGAKSVIGNYDYKVLNFPDKKLKWKKNKRPGKYLAFKWAHENLSAQNAKYLRALPEKLFMDIEGKRVLIVHGSSESVNEMITDETPMQRFEYLAATANADIIVFGHTHQALFRKVKGVWFINPGSVGRQGDGDPRAAYALMDITQDHLNLMPYRIEYDVDKAINAIRKAGLPEAFAEMFRRGYHLEAIEKRMPE